MSEKINTLVNTEHLDIWSDDEGVWVTIIPYNTTTYFSFRAFEAFASAIAESNEKLQK
jgi:hypothetical protein